MDKQTNTIPKPKHIRLFAVTEYDVTYISGTQPRKNMMTIGKIDTSDLMMIITWAMDMIFNEL